jgi:F0F1-type ATP synthase membrane subunit c/vacuolar-type H+-ATPase subunit K
MRKFLEIGGLVAAVVLIAFGVTAVVMGINGRSTVQDNLKLEQITGTPDMTPSAIAAEAKKAGLPASIKLPTKSVAGQAIDTGARARVFAQYMRIHTLEATGGVPYAQMPHYATADGTGTNDAAKALQSNGSPVDNPARNVWVTETALTTALNTAYMADQLALFGIVVGVALLLTGVGFGILAVGGALRNPETALTKLSRRSQGIKPVPTA